MRYLALVCFAALAAGEPLPVRGIHLAAPKPAELDLALRFITEALPRERVNTLVLEINYSYRFTRVQRWPIPRAFPASTCSALPTLAAASMFN